MAELKHGAHECVLTSPEIVADGICNMCYKDEPVEFACNTCNFDLCKPCSMIPQMVSHGFHPQHPLEFCMGKNDEKTRCMLCSGCGNLFSGSFYFKCKECEIYLDLDCGIQNIITGWEAEELLHYSHVHLLRRCKPGSDANGSCILCELPLSPSAICYGCVPCSSFVHQHCLDLPREIQHPMHPAHPLIRLDFTYNCGDVRTCDACRLDLDNAPPCQICMEGTDNSLDYYYHCVECGFLFHFDCLGIPESVVRKSYHIHPLFRKIFLAEDNSMEYCEVCETMVHAGHPAYCCKECDFLGHIECILREEVPSPLYFKDLYSDGEDVTRPGDQEDSETNKLDNKLMVIDTDHTHVLILAPTRELIVECSICFEDILIGKSWECKACEFEAHDICLKLGKPSKYRFHLDHLLTLLPSATQFLGEIHRGKKFIATTEELSKCLQHRHSVVEVMVSRSYPIGCTICVERLSGKVMSCMTCHDIYHSRCIELGGQERLSHPLHSDHPLKQSSGCLSIRWSHRHTFYNYWVDDWQLARTCNVCSRLCGKSFYGCIDCNFNAHVECLRFPAIVKTNCTSTLSSNHFLLNSKDWKVVLYVEHIAIKGFTSAITARTCFI
ncbi:hypothetical protein EUTSA_v10000096mg [Eutrema salsugineum]|uniref:Phorbol-ester/DAG-type domain-containing protein n=1 Tax=Eutrema salsugineum TaxID=72664 RepID=V4LUF9_EUTSA|nr:hypothetical protein EUTSA_v10000096mg [Eutrema salsugineum]